MVDVEQDEYSQLSSRHAELMLFAFADKECISYHRLDSAVDFSDLKERILDLHTLPPLKELSSWDNYCPMPAGALIVVSLNDYFARYTQANAKLLHTFGSNLHYTKSIMYAEVPWSTNDRQKFVAMIPSERFEVASRSQGWMWNDATDVLEVRVPDATVVYECQHVDGPAKLYHFEVHMPERALSSNINRISLILPYEGKLYYCKLADIVPGDYVTSTVFTSLENKGAPDSPGPWCSRMRQADGDIGGYNFYLHTADKHCKQWCEARVIAGDEDDWRAALHVKLSRDYHALYQEPVVDYTPLENARRPAKVVGVLVSALQVAGRAVRVPEVTRKVFAKIDALCDPRTGAEGFPYEPDPATINPEDAMRSARDLAELTAATIKTLQESPDEEERGWAMELQQGLSLDNQG